MHHHYSHHLWQQWWRWRYSDICGVWRRIVARAPNVNSPLQNLDDGKIGKVGNGGTKDKKEENAKDRYEPTYAWIGRFIRNQQNRHKENNVRHQTIHKSTFHIPIKQIWAVAAIVSTMSKSLTISSLSVSKMGSKAYALGNWPRARSCTDRQSMPAQEEKENKKQNSKVKSWETGIGWASKSGVD